MGPLRRFAAAALFAALLAAVARGVPLVSQPSANAPRRYWDETDWEPGRSVAVLAALPNNPTNPELMRVSLAVAADVQRTHDERMVSLENVDDLVGPIDGTKDFTALGGIIVLERILDAPSHAAEAPNGAGGTQESSDAQQLKIRSLTVLASAAGNDEVFASNIIKDHSGLFDRMVGFALPSGNEIPAEDRLMARKALVAVAKLVRSGDQARERFLIQNGANRVAEVALRPDKGLCFASSSDDEALKWCEHAVGLLEDLALSREQPSDTAAPSSRQLSDADACQAQSMIVKLLATTTSEPLSPLSNTEATKGAAPEEAQAEKSSTDESAEATPPQHTVEVVGSLPLSILEPSLRALEVLYRLCENPGDRQDLVSKMKGVVTAISGATSSDSIDDLFKQSENVLQTYSDGASRTTRNRPGVAMPPISSERSPPSLNRRDAAGSTVPPALALAAGRLDGPSAKSAEPIAPPEEPKHDAASDAVHEL